MDTKRLVTVVLVMVMVVGLGACTQDQTDGGAEPLAGTYWIESMTAEGNVIDRAMLEMIGMEGSYLLFREDGSAVLYFSGEDPVDLRYDEQKGVIYDDHRSMEFTRDGKELKLIHEGDEILFLKGEDAPETVPTDPTTRPTEPVTDVTDPKDETTGPKDETAEPTDDTTGPKDDPTEPKDDTTGPKDDPTEPKDDLTEPKDDPTEPKDDPTEPKDDTTGPKDDPTESKDDPTEPEDDPTEPKDDPTEPKDDPTEPQPTEPEDRDLAGMYWLYALTSEGDVMNYSTLKFSGLSESYLLIREDHTAQMYIKDKGVLEMVFDPETMTLNQKNKSPMFLTVDGEALFIDLEDSDTMTFLPEGDPRLK